MGWSATIVAALIAGLLAFWIMREKTRLLFDLIWV